MNRTLVYVIGGIVLSALVVVSCQGCATEELPALDATAGAAGSVGVDAESLLAPSPCYTAQINAIKAKLQGPLYYCKSAAWTTDGWNLYNSDCSSTSAYGVWIPAQRGNGSSTCSFSIRRIDDDGNPPGYCSWKLGTVNASGSSVTITNDANSCW